MTARKSTPRTRALRLQKAEVRIQKLKNALLEAHIEWERAAAAMGRKATWERNVEGAEHGPEWLESCYTQGRMSNFHIGYLR